MLRVGAQERDLIRDLIVSFTVMLYVITEGWALGVARFLARHFTVAHCVGVRPPKMKVGVLLIAQARTCSDF